MNILHTVEFYSPSVGGAQEVVKQISERLVKRGHNVTVATSKLRNRTQSTINGVNIVEFDVSGNFSRSYSGEIDRYKDFILNSEFDVMMNYAAQQWATDLVLPLLNKISAKKVFVPCGYSGLFLSEYHEYFENMKTWLKQYDKCIYLSKNYRDINFAKENGITNDVWIPNGAGEDEFNAMSTFDIKSFLRIPPNHFLIIHVGSHTGAKGHKEAIEIFKKAKIPHSTLLIIANNFGGGCTNSCHRSEKFYRWNPYARILDKNIIIKSLSREETVAAYQSADLFLFPSNIECSPIVLFECMASRTPFLTTDVGNAREIISWSQSGILLPTIKDSKGYSHADIMQSKKSLEEIYHNPAKLSAMQDTGFHSWQKRFSWEKIACQYEELYSKLMTTEVQ
jgi:glycosyltransferase involved in cell wall biosynthesis